MQLCDIDGKNGNLHQRPVDGNDCHANELKLMQCEALSPLCTKFNEVKLAPEVLPELKSASIIDNSKGNEESGQRYQCEGPKVSGDTKALFGDDGLAFKIVSKDEDGIERWHLYNDTDDRELHVKWMFGAGSEVTACGAGKQMPSDGNTIDITATVYPRQTVAFIEAISIRGYRCSFSMQGLGAEYLQKILIQQNQVIHDETLAVQRHCEGMAAPTSAEVLSICIKNDVNFVDPEFHPNQHSLCRPEFDTHLKAECHKIMWKRPTQYLNASQRKRLQLVRNAITPDDIDQGKLGDCWFLCAIAALAEFPKLLLNLFSGNCPAENKVGAYRVRICKHGWWQDVIVDSYLPVRDEKPLFAKTIEDPSEIWVSILEKAYAKLHGSYSAIAGGTPLHALIDLTGLPGWSFHKRFREAKSNPAVADELFNDLLAWDYSRHLLTIYTPDMTGENMQQQYKQIGLVPGHAHTLLRVIHIPEKNIKMLKIRNPWGNAKEWTGEWSDSDPRWKQEPELVAKCDFTDDDNGVFNMPWSAVLQFFDGGEVCCRLPIEADCRAKGRFLPGGVPSVAFKVTNRGKEHRLVTFTLSQPDVRADVESDRYQPLLLTAIGAEDEKNESQAKMVVKASTGETSLKPSRNAMTFRAHRDQSIMIEIPPGVPSLIVPRAYRPEACSQYVLAAGLSSAACQALSVDFIELPGGCDLLRDYTWFEMPDAVPAVIPPAHSQVYMPKTMRVIESTEELSSFESLLKDAFKNHSACNIAPMSSDAGDSTLVTQSSGFAGTRLQVADAKNSTPSNEVLIPDHLDLAAPKLRAGMYLPNDVSRVPITEAELRELHAKFMHFAKLEHDDGMMSWSEFCAAFESLEWFGHPPSQNEMRRIFDNLIGSGTTACTEGRQTITFQEFAVLMLQRSRM